MSQPWRSTLVTVTGPTDQPLTFIVNRYHGDGDEPQVGVAYDVTRGDPASSAIPGFWTAWDAKRRTMRAPDPAQTAPLRAFFGNKFAGALALWIEASRRLAD
jgi:hypothetical protein